MLTDPGWNPNQRATIERALDDIASVGDWPATLQGLRGFWAQNRIRPMPLVFRIGTAWGMALGPVFFLRPRTTVDQADPLERRVHTAAVMFHEYQHIVQYLAGRSLMREGVLAYVLGSRQAHRALEMEPYQEEIRFVARWAESDASLRPNLQKLQQGLAARVSAF